MAKIREDLIGAVHVDGHVLYAGDTVPRGLKVGAHLTTAEPKSASKQVSESLIQGDGIKAREVTIEDNPKPKRGRPPKKKPEADDASVD